MASAHHRTALPATPYRTVVADGLPDLDQRLSDELDKVNALATEGVSPSRELTVQILDDSGRARGRDEWLDLGCGRRHRDDLGA